MDLNGLNCDIIELIETVKNISYDSLSTAWKSIYQQVYDEFKDWLNGKGYTSLDVEDVLIEYFNEKLTSLGPSVVRAKYCMLRATLQAHDQINIDTFERMVKFLQTVHFTHESCLSNND